MIYGILLAFHILVSAVLMLVVLLQSGKGGGLAGAFGAAGGQTGQMLFGGRGAATFLSKATTVLGVAFMLTSLLLAITASQSSGPQSIIRSADPGTIAPPIDAPAPTPGALDLPAGSPDEGGALPEGAVAPGAEAGASPTEGTPVEGSGETPPGGGAGDEGNPADGP